MALARTSFMSGMRMEQFTYTYKAKKHNIPVDHILDCVKIAFLLRLIFTELFTGPAPLSPLAAPILTPTVSQNAIGYFSVSLPENAVPAMESWSPGEPVPGPVSFLFKVVDPQDTVTRYFWQVHLQHTPSNHVYIQKYIAYIHAYIH